MLPPHFAGGGYIARYSYFIERCMYYKTNPIHRVGFIVLSVRFFYWLAADFV
jgi:hypothetical protein